MRKVSHWLKLILPIACVLAGVGLFAQTSTSTKKSIKTKTATSTKSRATVHKVSHSSKHKKSRRKGSWKTRGQQKIDSDRAREIQQALIRNHYMSGEATGVWDNATQNAMVKYQEDHGWQSKTIPDSRALISLGLGPAHDHLLNPESAMTTEPAAAPTSKTPTPVSTPAEPTSTPIPPADSQQAPTR